MPRVAALSSSFFASQTLSFSTRDDPTGTSWAARNVYAIAPPMMRALTRVRRASITPILSDTFAPPSTATYGRSGFSMRAPSFFSSVFTRKPAARRPAKWFGTRATEASPRWQVPNASLT